MEIVMAEGTCDIGLIGLAVMGQNLVLNMNDHGYKVAVFNRTTSKVDEFLADEAKGTKVVGTHSAKELCAALKLPRRHASTRWVDATAAEQAAYQELAALTRGLVADGQHGRQRLTAHHCQLV